MATEVSLVRMYKDAIVVSAPLAMARGVERSTLALPSVVEAFGKSVRAGLFRTDKMARVNLRIAQAAQRAVVAGLASRLPRGSHQGTLSGRLLPALASESMTARTSDRVISFANTAVLNERAKHWYRVNYGAAGPVLQKPGGHEAGTFTVKINNRPFVTLRDDAPPAPLSWLPAGFVWVGDRFVVTRGPATPRGRGARAARFLDVGLKVVAQHFGPEYHAYFAEYLKSERNRGQLAKKDINVIADVRMESYGWKVSTH